MKKFGGKVLFLDRNDINTDEIIPAKYLTEISKAALKPYCLEDLSLDGFDPSKDIKGKGVVITRENFGCGSSREHAPWVFEVNDINVVIGVSFARIFRQNMFNCGMMAIELDKQTVEDVFKDFKGKDTECLFDIDKSRFTLRAGSFQRDYSYKISDYDSALVNSGGWVEFADKKY